MKFKIGDRVIVNQDIIEKRKINPVTTSMSLSVRRGVITKIKEGAIWPYLVESYDYMGKHEEHFNDKNLTLDIEEIRNDKLKQIGI
jgi:hypothetical protein